MVWLTCLLLLPCSLAYKQYATSRSHPEDVVSRSGTLVKAYLSDLSVPTPWTDWSLSAWIKSSTPYDPNIQTTDPAQKLEVTGGNLVLSGDNISTQSRSVVLAPNVWHMLILGSYQQATYAIYTTRSNPLYVLETSGQNGVPAPLQSTTTFEVMSGATLFSVRVM